MLDGERVNDLAARLLPGLEGDEPAGYRHPRFFLELAHGCREGVFAASNSPFGIDQERSSLRAQKGPPGWTSSISGSPARQR